MNVNSLITSALVLALAAIFAPGGMLKWGIIAVFVVIWLPLAHFGYGYYDKLTVEKR